MTGNKTEALGAEMGAYTGWHTSRTFDWAAFPASRGYPEVSRAQMRNVGAGGPPEADGPSALRPATFTLSLVHQPVGKFGAADAHEVEEALIVFEDVLTVGWEEDGLTVEQRLGPTDLIFTRPGRVRSFRNDGFEPAEFMIVVGTDQPESVRFQAAP